MKTANSRSKSKSNKRHSQSQKKIKTEEDFFENILNINIDKPMTAYNFYIREQMSKNKITKLIEASKLYAPKWKKMSDKEKERFDKMVEDDKVRYEENLKLVKKYLIDPDMLKEQVSPYMAFKRAYVDNMINEQGLEPADARAKAKDAWDDLSKEEKKQWEDEFEKKKDLLEELKDFKPGVVNAYSMYVRDKVANSDMNFKEAAEAWKKVSATQKEKYHKYAEEENKERRKKLALWEVNSGIRPKKPVRGLTHFIRELSKEDKLSGVKNVFSYAAAKYKELPESERERFEKLFKQEQLEYSIKLAEYKKFLSNRFGRAPTAINLYFQDHAGDYDEEDMKPGDALRILSERWKKESEATKEKYNERAAKEKEKFDEYKEQQLNLKPPSRPMSAYQYFVQENFSTVKEKNPKSANSEIFGLIAEKWSKTKDADRVEFVKKAETDKERYDREIQEFEKDNGIRGRTKSTQRFFDDSRLLSSKESGYSKYKSQLSYQARSQSKAKRSKSKSKSKESESSKSKAKNSDKKSKSKKKDNKEKEKEKKNDKKNEKKSDKDSNRSRSKSVNSKKSQKK
jgi:hypothetical protein